MIICSEDPVGQLSFISADGSTSIEWRDKNAQQKHRIYTYGVLADETYRVVCNVQHHSNNSRPMRITVQYFSCSVYNCLSKFVDRSCQGTSKNHMISTRKNPVNQYQTQWITVDTHRLIDSSIGYLYLCCDENNPSIVINRAITVLSSNS